MRKILSIAFFPAFSPPTSGGELRLLNLYRALSATHDVTLLTSTDFGARFEQINHGPSFREFRFPKDQLWRDAYATLERSGVSGDLSGLAFALAVSDPTCRLRLLARELEPAMDVVVHEFPFSEPIFADGTSAKEVYNSHNFEASLLGSIVRGQGFDTAIARLLRLEANLTARATRVFATSAVDAEKFRLFYGVEPARLGLCPNGFDAADLARVVARRGGPRPDKDRLVLLFMGSAHPPNVEAARFLVGLASEHPQFHFIVAGGVAEALGQIEATPNLFLVGRFDDQGKIDLLSHADIFLNPVRLGSGTSLKAIEALGAGVPLLSTSEGVRGLDIWPDRDAVVVGRDGFAAALLNLAADKPRRDRLAASGLDRATTLYAWPRIAAAFGAELAGPGGTASPERPLAIAFNDYPIDWVESGGRARMVGLLSNLDRDVALLSFGATFDVRFLAPGLMHVTVPKTAAHRSFQAEVNEGQTNSADDCVAALFAAANPVLAQTVALLLPHAGLAIFEHCYMVGVLDLILAERPDLPVVYSAHNIEADQKALLLRSHPAAGSLVALAADLEAELVKRAQLIVCCTEADARRLSHPGTPTIVVPNGCTIPQPEVLAAIRSEQPSGPPRVGFLGSGHGPNADAVAYMARELAPAFPEVDFECVGGASTTWTGDVPPNLHLHGLVGEAEKTAIEARWTLALNPVAVGSGSSLKLPDYMAHGLPTLSTPEGARGVDVAGRDAGTVVALEDIPRALRHVLADPATLLRQGRNAYRYAAAELSWPALTRPYRAALDALVSPESQPAGLSLLVVTYRYTEPALGGAEEYLCEVLGRLRPRLARLDLAAIDVEGLTNHHHFGTRFPEAGRGAATRLAALFDRALFFAPDPVPHEDLVERSRRLERTWFEEEHALMLGFAAEIGKHGVQLLAGFYPPEQHERGLRRWTAPDCSVLLPPRAVVLRLVGYVASAKSLTVTVARLGSDEAVQPVAKHVQPLQGGFTVNLVLPEASRGGAVLVQMATEEHHAAGDHRPFGLLLESISVLTETERPPGPRPVVVGLDETTVDLAVEQDRVLRAAHPERWIEALRDVALRRPPAAEDDFARTRGPHSAELQRFLAAEGQGYDTVLVQGIPFDVVPSAVATLARLSPRPRIVVLPHFHGDDRFYYWRRYLDAFEEADATLLFSPTLAARLGFPEAFAVVPGGGIDADQHGDAAAVGQFREVHADRRPFFLVLGRKTATKGYRRIVAARATLAGRPEVPDLVLIGPDEDGLPLEASGIHYLGRQPRDVVRGALAECLGVVTMSESESFGIVLCEAWIFGKPVIANADCLSFRELVDDGRTGVLVRSDADLAAALWCLARDPAERERLGQAGQAVARRNYAWQRVADAVFETLM